jgi:hypothetical protein
MLAPRVKAMHKVPFLGKRVLTSVVPGEKSSANIHDTSFGICLQYSNNGAVKAG